MKLEPSKLNVDAKGLVIIHDTICAHCEHKKYPICKEKIDLRKKKDFKSCLFFKEGKNNET